MALKLKSKAPEKETAPSPSPPSQLQASSPASAAKPKKLPSPNAGRSLAHIGLERFEVVEIHRKDLKNAQYNPRVINDNQKRKLKAGLQEHGMVSIVTWNVRTGHIVGGHQRIKALDDLAGTNDYTLKVAKIDVPEHQEKELNLLLNNPEAMGEWDLDKLTVMFKDQSVRMEKTGFDHADLYKLLGDSPFTERGHDSEVLIERLEQVRGEYDRAMDAKGSEAAQERLIQHNAGFYLVCVFRDVNQCDEFCYKYGFDLMTRFVSGERLIDLLQKPLEERETKDDNQR